MDLWRRGWGERKGRGGGEGQPDRETGRQSDGNGDSESRTTRKTDRYREHR